MLASRFSFPKVFFFSIPFVVFFFHLPEDINPVCFEFPLFSLLSSVLSLSLSLSWFWPSLCWNVPQVSGSLGYGLMFKSQGQNKLIGSSGQEVGLVTGRQCLAIWQGPFLEDLWVGVS